MTTRRARVRPGQGSGKAPRPGRSVMQTDPCLTTPDAALRDIRCTRVHVNVRPRRSKRAAPQRHGIPLDGAYGRVFVQSELS